MGGVVQFEFNRDDLDPSLSVTAGRTRISIDNTMSTAEVIQAMITVINASLDVEALAPNPAKDPNRVFLARAMDVDATGAPTLTVQGDTPGTVSGGNIRVPIRGDMDLLQVGEIVTQVVNQQPRAVA